MNHIHRVIWNVRTGNWVVVAEIVRTRGKRGGRSVGKVLFSALMTSGLGVDLALAESPATVVPAGGKTNAYISANGVPVVNIETANASGLSHNRYTRYDVEAKGLVLNNNGIRSQLQRQSQLAGQVAANPNLVKEANVILNEVVSSNRSTLAGFTEVVGSRADVIVANPYGITCNGCGFINTDRATLTTGTSNIAEDGSLKGFTVNRGDIMIEAAGANASTQEIFDLVARKVIVKGKVNTSKTGSLGITTGNNKWNYADRKVTDTVEGSGEKPSYAIDSTALGGMYAGKIRIIATEEGVGVRMLGDVAASADDFTLSSAGKIEIQSAISAERDVNIASTSASGDRDLFVKGMDASLSAKRDLAVSATRGQITLSDAELYAVNHLKLEAATLSDVSTAAKTRFAGANNTVSTSGTASIDGASYGAGGALSGTFDSLSVEGRDAKMYAGTTLDLTTTKDLQLRKAAVKSEGDMSLTARDGEISTEAGENQGLQSKKGNLKLTADRGLKNAGTITADAGNVTVRIDGTLDNSGTLQAENNLDIADKRNGRSEDITNSGTLLADGRITAKAASVSNQGTVQGTAGTTLEATELTNEGTFIASNTAGKSGTFTLATLTNTGTLQSKGSAALNLATSLDNQGDLLTDGALTVRGTNASYTVINDGRMQSGGQMDVKGQGGGRGVTITVGSTGVIFGDSLDVYARRLRVDNGGMVTSSNGMTLNLNTLSFDGSESRIVGATSGGTTEIKLATGFRNPGAIHSGGALNFDAPWITNSRTGGISALDTLNVNATEGNLNNYGALYAGSQLNARATETFTNGMDADGNGGTIDAYNMILSAATFVNNHEISATGDITINSTVDFRNEYSGGLPEKELDWANMWVTNTDVSMDEENNCTHCNWIQTYTDTIEVKEKIKAGSAPLPATKPQILAGNNLTISFGTGTAKNSAAVLSATNTLTIYGTGRFTNETFDLDTYQYQRKWFVLMEDCFDCSAKEYSYRYAYNDSTFSDNPIFEGENSYLTYDHNAGPWGGSGSSTDTENSKKRDQARDTAYKKNFGVVSTDNSSSAGIYAGTLVFDGPDLINKGSPYSVTINPPVAVNGTNVVNGAGAIRLRELGISLPTNPNGYFVVTQGSDASYLIETNPLFAVGSKFVGSHYLERLYGYNPDTIIKHLGDANYEAYLIRQQLIDQTGNNILSGYGKEAEQMKRLMDQAVVEGKRLGLVFGQPLTSDQINNLQEDVVWMVETTVAGQQVLAPKVYLSANTRNGIETGAVIAAEHVTMDVKSVSNIGATISGSNLLNITAQSDITNTSGTIKGGDVAVKSIDGSIKNETLATGIGDDNTFVTSIGKQANITANGNMNLDAKKDITVLGADVKAGGDAVLTAGGNVTFDTVVNKTTQSSGANRSSTEKNIGSVLASGGNLQLKSGDNTTIAGSQVSTGGNLDVDAGGDFNVLARQDKTTTHSVSETSGLGVGGGVTGTETTTTDRFKGTNAGSTISVGGNATVKAEASMTVQGSDVTITGDAAIDATQGINILDGLDEEWSNTVTETTTVLKIDRAGKSASNADSKSGSESGPGRANATASAKAGAEASGTADIKFEETTTTTTLAGSTTSVASNINVGGKLTAKTDATLKVQGSNIESGGDMDLEANNVEVLTGRNEAWSTTETVRTSVGIYNEGESKAEAGADAQAKAGTAGTDADASAKASAEANGTTTIGARTENENSTDYSLTHSSSSLQSGGNLSIKAKETAKFVGANVESGGDMNIEATDVVNKAAQDLTFKTSTKTTHTAGLYIDAYAGTEAKTSADAGKIHVGGDPANAEAGAKAEANVSAGLRYKNEQESSVEGSVTQVTSSFKSGGNFTRNAENSIVDQGTQIEAGGDINQSAREIKEIAANNSTFSSKDASSHDVKLGVGASASAEASANAKGETEKDAGAAAGLRAKYKGSLASESESTTTAVTTRYKSGGNMTSKSDAKTTLIGTQIESGGDVNIEAGSLEYQAAKDTTAKRSSADNIDAKVKVDVYGQAGASLDASYGNERGEESTSTARTGSIDAGGNLNIKTKGDASFEGTDLVAGDKADIAAGGSVDFKAVRDTTESSKSAIDASLELKASKASKGSKGSKGTKASAGYSQEDSSGSTAQTGSIKAGGGGINITAGKDASFEGTKLKSDGDSAIGAGGNVNLKAVENTATTTAFGVEGSIGAEKDKDSSKKKASIGGRAAYADKVDSDVTSIKSGGKVTISGSNVVNQQATINAKDGKQIVGNEVKVKAESSDIAVGISVTVSGESETKKAESGESEASKSGA